MRFQVFVRGGFRFWQERPRLFAAGALSVSPRLPICFVQPCVDRARYAYPPMGAPRRSRPVGPCRIAAPTCLSSGVERGRVGARLTPLEVARPIHELFGGARHRSAQQHPRTAEWTALTDNIAVFKHREVRASVAGQEQRNRLGSPEFLIGKAEASSGAFLSRPLRNRSSNPPSKHS